MNPLRFALNHTRLDSSGGVEGYIFSLLHHLLERGHRVDFFGGKFPLKLKHPNFRVIRLPFPRSPRLLRVASFALLSHRYIAREERKQPYDITQGFSRTYYHTLYRDGSGCWRDYRELYLDPLARKGLHGLYCRISPLDKLVEAIERKRYVTQPQRMVIAISSFVRDQILRRYPVPPETIRVVYSGVDCERFHPRLREEGRSRISAFFPPSPAAERHRHLAFIGNDYQRKGLDLVLEALAGRSRNSRPSSLDFRLVVAGGDSRSHQYERKAGELGLSSRVRFLGKRSDIPELLAGSDVLLLPSYFDAYANVSSEALSSGTPVIASRTSGAAELIRPGHGWVMERNDVAELSRCLSNFFAVAECGPLREAARAQALLLSWDKHYQLLEELYGEIAAEGKRK